MCLLQCPSALMMPNSPKHCISPARLSCCNNFALPARTFIIHCSAASLPPEVWPHTITRTQFQISLQSMVIDKNLFRIFRQHQRTTLEILIDILAGYEYFRQLSSFSSLYLTNIRFYRKERAAQPDLYLRRQRLARTKVTGGNISAKSAAEMLPPVTFVLARRCHRRFKSGFAAISFKIFSAPHPERLPSFSFFSSFVL